MDEEILENPEIVEAEEKPAYTPRPKWQVWGAWVALAVFLLFLVLYYTNIFRGGK